MPTKFQTAIAKMPSLRHSFPDQPFDISKSQALKWSLEQPEILTWLWDHIRSSGACKFNQATGEWTGHEAPPPVVGRPRRLEDSAILSCMGRDAESATGAGPICRAVMSAVDIREATVKRRLWELAALGTISRVQKYSAILYYAPTSISSETSTTEPKAKSDDTVTKQS